MAEAVSILTTLSDQRTRERTSQGEDMIRIRRPTALLLLFLAALVIRMAAIRVTGPTRLEFGDARDYLATATTFSTAGTWPERGSLPFFRAPGLPLFIIGVTGGHPERVEAAKIGLAVVDSLNVLLIWGLALVLSGGSRWAWGAGPWSGFANIPSAMPGTWAGRSFNSGAPGSIPWPMAV